jgi:hypothetical protein
MFGDQAAPPCSRLVLRPGRRPPRRRPGLRRSPRATGLVVVGERDPSAGADALAAAIPGARFTRVPGDHDALPRPEMLAAILAFLDGPG